jgi:hypothetical protein
MATTYLFSQRSSGRALACAFAIALAALMLMCNSSRAQGELLPKHVAQPKFAAASAQLRIDALKRDPSIIPLAAKLDALQSDAQSIALADSRVKSLARGQPGNKPLLLEVFGVYPLRASDIVEPVAACRTHTCYRVEIYSYAANATFLVFVDSVDKKVINTATIVKAQPDIPEHLTQVALEIATQSPDVAKVFGEKPSASPVLMASTKTSLNRTRCERSRHLCVAPTFVKGDRALWVIVDLTDLRVVGTRWTNVGRTAGAVSPARPVTEARLQNDVITENFCEKETALKRDGWSLNYMLTSSDGLRVSDVSFNAAAVFDSVKLVDWHVSYSRKDAFGYSDAVGCPFFSQSAVIAAEPPRIEDIKEGDKVVGFALTQHFWSEGWPTPCNYYYLQRNEFYVDGRFRPMAASVGRGCGTDGTYRPVTRIAFAESGAFAEWSGKNWSDWSSERWQLVDNASETTKDGFRYRLLTEKSSAKSADPKGFYIAPSTGQFGDGGRGDTPYVYVTKRHTNRDEGDSDLPTLGPCCNINHEQGPEKFINTPPESIADSKMVLWYVPILKNDGREGKEYCWANSVIENGLVESKMFPCFSGPMLTPVSRATADAAKKP